MHSPALRRSLDTEESRRFWLSVAIAAYRVDRWAPWKRGGAAAPGIAGYPVLEAVVRPFEIMRALSGGCL